MIPRATTKIQTMATIDKRIWWMVMAIGLFGFLIVKEIALPRVVMVACGSVGLLGLLMVGLQSPEVPLYVLVAYIPFSRLLVGDFGTRATAFNMTNILMVWVFIAYALRQASQGKSLFERTPLNKVVLLFSLMGAAALLRASWSYGSWYIWGQVTSLKQWLTPMVFYFLAFWVARDRRILKTVAVVIMVAVTVVALMAIRDYSYASDSSIESSRVGGIVEHSNTLAAFFVYYMFLFLGFFMVYSKRKLKVWLLLIPFLLCFRGIMVTFSRGGYMAFGIGGIAACFFRSKGLFLACVLVILFAVANPWLLPAGIRYRMGQTVKAGASLDEGNLEQNLEASASIRLRIWKGAAQMIKEHPMWGIGYGAFPNFIPYYAEGPIGQMDAHNSYLLIAAEMGIPTLVVFLLILVMVCYYTYWLYRHTTDQAIKAITLGFLAGLAGLVVANMFGSRMDSQEAAGYWWILSGLMMRGVLIERAEGRRQKAEGRRRGNAMVAGATA